MLFSDVIAAKISWTRTLNVLKHGGLQIGTGKTCRNISG